MQNLNICLIRFSLILMGVFVLVSCGMTKHDHSSLQRYSNSKPRPIPQLTHKQAKPLKIVQPCFPYRAIKLNAEGWVQLEFSLNNQGFPVDIEPIDDSPKGVFKDCALKSLKRWSFQLPNEHRQGARYQFVFQFKLG